MPTVKIADLPKTQTCRDPEHKVPSGMVFEPGIWEHTCPACGKKTKFRYDGHQMFFYPEPTSLPRGSRREDYID